MSKLDSSWTVMMSGRLAADAYAALVQSQDIRNEGIYNTVRLGHNAEARDESPGFNDTKI
jgi:hypothetical protein